MSPEIKLRLTLNGRKRVLTVHPMKRLLDVLRDEAELTGTKEGCGEGECGACGVMVDGRLVNSCLIPAAQLEGSSVKTIEGIKKGKKLSLVQQAFLENGGAQCGICTPGIIIAVEALLERNPQPTEEEIRVGLAGNLCRCTGYVKIIDSVLAAIQKDSSGKKK